MNTPVALEIQSVQSVVLKIINLSPTLNDAMKGWNQLKQFWTQVYS